MKVRRIDAWVGHAPAGAVIDMPDDLARLHIAHGSAELVVADPAPQPQPQPVDDAKLAEMDGGGAFDPPPPPDFVEPPHEKKHRRR